MMNRKTFKVDYTTVKNGSRSRQSGFVTQSQLPAGAASQFAVVAYLQSRHSGAEIEINNLYEV